MSLINTKSLLAKLMATENLRIHQAKVETASFNVETRVLTIPIMADGLSKDIYDLFMGHEVGHALWTTKSGLEKAIKQKLNKDVVNIVEDSRIERKIKSRYPGLKSPFIRAYNDLYEKNFFGTKEKVLDDMNFLDRLNLYSKVGAGLNIQFTDFEKTLVKKVETTETFKEVLAVSKEIQDYLGQEAQEKQKLKVKVKIKVAASEEGEEDQNPEEMPDEEADVIIEIDATGEKTEEKKDTKDSEEEKEEEPEQEDGKSSDGREGTHAEEALPPEEIKSETDEAFHQRERELFQLDSRTIYAYGNVPTFDLKRIYDYKDLWRDYVQEGYSVPSKEFMAFKKESAKVVSYLVKEFELRKNADQLKRASVAKTGDLNMSKLYSHGFNEDLFKKITVLPGGKSHGLVMFLDWSGSMLRHLENTAKQLLNLVLFCKQVNIPFEVYAFLDQSKTQYMIKPSKKPGDLAVNEFCLANLLSSRMSPTEFITGAAGLMQICGMSRGQRRIPQWLYLSGTPLNEAVIAAMEIVPEFQKKYRLQVVNTVFLTDGEGAGIRGVVDDTGYIDNHFTHLVMHDPKTHREETYTKLAYQPMGQTTKLLALLKARTNSNVIGFFVCQASDIGFVSKHYWPDRVQDSTGLENLKAEFRNERFLVAKTEGFDEYYFIRSSGMNTDEGELEFRENSTTRGMATAFAKYAGNKIHSRVVLNRFIGLIV